MLSTRLWQRKRQSDWLVPVAFGLDELLHLGFDVITNVGA